jgi:hypothetical protein
VSTVLEVKSVQKTIGLWKETGKISLENGVMNRTLRKGKSNRLRRLWPGRKKEKFG